MAIIEQFSVSAWDDLHPEYVTVADGRSLEHFNRLMWCSWLGSSADLGKNGVTLIRSYKELGKSAHITNY